MLWQSWRKTWLRDSQGAIVALYFLTVAGAAQAEDQLAWLLALPLISAIALFAWLSALRRRRSIDDTPTSRVSSAAQGYVELRGQGQPFDSGCIYSRLRLHPCLWFRYQIEKRDSEDKWQTCEEGDSDDSFVLVDGEGRCVIDPAGAEISTSHRDHWRQGDLRYTEWLIQEGDPLYALGDFRTIGGLQQSLDATADLNALLNQWKSDPVELRRRFGLDGDGDISEQEWQLARQAARREIDRQHQASRRQEPVNVLRRPEDGRPFLVSNLPPESLSRRYGWWALAHLVVFFAALAALPWVYQTL